MVLDTFPSPERWGRGERKRETLMGLFSKSKKEEQTPPPVYEQPIVSREKPTYDHQAKPNAKQESMMLDFALGHGRESDIEKLAEQGWLYGRNGWVKRK